MLTVTSEYFWNDYEMIMVVYQWHVPPPTKIVIVILNLPSISSVKELESRHSCKSTVNLICDVCAGRRARGEGELTFAQRAISHMCHAMSHEYTISSTYSI